MYVSWPGLNFMARSNCVMTAEVIIGAALNEGGDARRVLFARVLVCARLLGHLDGHLFLYLLGLDAVLSRDAPCLLDLRRACLITRAYLHFELAALDGEVADLVCHALLIRLRPRAWATLVVARRHLGECTLARANSL